MTVDCNKLKGLKKKLCEGWTVDKDNPGEWRELTANEHARYLALFAGDPIPPKEPKKKSTKTKLLKKPLTRVGPGTELETIFKSFKFPTCGRCALLKDDMNSWGVEGCEENMETILKRLKKNASLIPIMGRVFSKTPVEPLVRLAINNAKIRESGGIPSTGLIHNTTAAAKGVISNLFSKPTELTWSYGVTTVPERIGDLLPRTLNSLKKAGFGNPHLFLDKCPDSSIYAKFNLPFTCHSKNIRTFGNWVTALWELYVLNPHADRYALFQDDFVTYPNLREYLDGCEYPEKGYWNLLTFHENQKLIQNKPEGWHLASQNGRGAVALVFNIEAVTSLLSHEHMINRPKSKTRGHKSIDGGIVESFRKMGWKEFIHNPSLVQHTGLQSSMGNGRHPSARSFKGENFDAKSWNS
jgi:hypothetical protein